VIPLILERFFEGGVKRSCLARVVRGRPQSFRPFWRWRQCVELDRHPVEVPRDAVAARVKQDVRALVIVDDAIPKEPDPAPARIGFHELEQVRTDSAVPGARMDVDIDEGVSLREQRAITG
jgi:hypothetical protein